MSSWKEARKKFSSNDLEKIEELIAEDSEANRHINGCSSQKELI